MIGDLSLYVLHRERAPFFIGWDYAILITTNYSHLPSLPAGKLHISNYQCNSVAHGG